MPCRIDHFMELVNAIINYLMLPLSLFLFSWWYYNFVCKVYVCVCVCAHVFAHVSMCLCLFVCVRVCVHTHVHICVLVTYNIHFISQYEAFMIQYNNTSLHICWLCSSLVYSGNTTYLAYYIRKHYPQHLKCIEDLKKDETSDPGLRNYCYRLP